MTSNPLFTAWNPFLAPAAAHDPLAAIEQAGVAGTWEARK